MKHYVYDAGALGLVMAGDNRLRVSTSQVSRGEATAHSSVVNLAELYYKTGQKLGIETAETWFVRIANSNLQIEHADPDLARDAGIHKIHYRGKLSLADCFAVAETTRRDAVLLTTDRDMEQVKEIPVRYFKV